MAVKQVDLYVSQILEDLNNGLTWLKRDDLGYGNIQDKYGAKDQQIAMIRKHPALKNAETNVTVFNIIDDTKKTDEPAPAPVSDSKDDSSLARVSKPVENATPRLSDINHTSSSTNTGRAVSETRTGGDEFSTGGTAELDAFANI